MRIVKLHSDVRHLKTALLALYAGYLDQIITEQITTMDRVEERCNILRQMVDEIEVIERDIAEIDDGHNIDPPYVTLEDKGANCHRLI